jgi:hypothetical protein
MRPSSKLGTEYSDAEKDIVVDDQPHNQASDDAGLAESSYAAAARERKAFGIPASESDEVYRPGVAMLPHATSDLSSVGSTLWHEDCEELSMGAEELFRKLSGRQGTERDQCRSTGMDTECGSHKPFDTDDIISRELGLGTQISRSSGSSSNYEKDLTEPPWPPKQQENNSVIQLPSSDGTWRSSLSQREYESLHERHGEMEMHRQEVIWNFRETEELFVKQLLSMVRLFIRPLRAQNTNTWITGVPMDVARLLDWVEDIANLHTQILSVLQSTRHGQSPVVEIAAESLRSFVPRLEVYQPYLVRLEEVIATVTHLAQDQDSDFGEFVKIQERGSTWSLRSFLMEPQARLQQYLVIFRVSETASMFPCLICSSPETQRPDTKRPSGLLVDFRSSPFHRFSHSGLERGQKP